MERLDRTRKLGEYLRTLRRGYGYSVRTVEQKAKQDGWSLDNSQLTRYENGSCFPTLDKLNALADVYNVSIQSFSDIVDLAKFDEYKDDSKDYDSLMRTAREEFISGNFGQAYALYESAIKKLNENKDRKDFEELKATTILTKAIALTKLGRLGIAENELRSLLRSRSTINNSIFLSVLLQLSLVHAELGDTCMASIEARTCYERAMKENDLNNAAYALHQLGRISAENGENEKAISYYKEAKQIYEKLNNAPKIDQEIEKVNIDIGGRLVSLGKFKEGTQLIREALKVCEDKDYKRTAAFALYKLAYAFYLKGAYRKARLYVKKSNAKCESTDGKHIDIKFLNAFYTWKMAIKEKKDIEERLCFGRLKCYRKLLERRFQEVEEFDTFIERGKIS